MNPEDIPGMTERIEQKLLNSIGQSVKLEADEVMLEFGTYFGRSTRSIVNGVLQNKNIDLTSRLEPVLKVYDSFCLPNEGAFDEHMLEEVDSVKRMASHGSVQNLLKEQDGKINFRAIFDHYMSDIPEKVLDVFESGLYQMEHDGLAIKFMHIDLPKWWEEYKYLIDTFFFYLRKGAILIYQDFFYHWSATLIVAIFLWIEEGLLEPVRTAASSLVCNINREIVEDDVRNLEAQMKSIDCLEVLNRCQNYFAKFDSVDRREYFVNRLLLAQLQYSFEKGDFNDSRAIFSFFMEQKAVLSQAQLKDLDGLYGDLLDLVGNGFSVRRV